MKAIPGYEGIYEITDAGEIYSVRNNKWLKPFVNKFGYVKVALCVGNIRKTFSVHRLMGLSFLGLEPTQQIDHIDRNRGNNSIANLRIATNSQNHFNTNGRSGSKSGLKGVTWDRSKERWRVTTMVQGRVYFIGTFRDKFHAKEAYDTACEKLHGEFFHGRALEAV